MKPKYDLYINENVNINVIYLCNGQSHLPKYYNYK